MKIKNILVIRISSIGDVAMTVPLLQQLLQQNQNIQITVLTQSFLAPLFEPLERTTVHPILKNSKHKGIFGLWRLYRELKKKYRFDVVADLHNVLRTKILRFFFRLSGVRVASINKGRKEKKLLTRKKNKNFVQLKTTFQRYADVFNELKIPVILNTSASVFSKRPLPETIKSIFSEKKKNILVAPFAGFKEKIYPLEKTKSLICELVKQPDIQIFILGNGKNEVSILNAWEKEIKEVINLSEKYSLKEELDIISNLDLVVSMDSASMHLASLFNVPVISIWGATHMYAGFYGWNQLRSNAMQIDLYCRPCSVYGNKICYRGDHACMTMLDEKLILDKVNEVLKSASLK